MYDIVIVGAGPTGIYAGFYAGLRGLNGLVLEGSKQIGGQAMTLYKDKPVYDFPGNPKTTGQGLIDNLLAQFKTIEDKVKIRVSAVVQKMEKIDDGFKLIVNDEEILTKTICLSLGPGTTIPKKLEIEDEDKHDVSYLVKNPDDFKGKNVVIFGGGDSAIDWANFLKKDANVTLVHRRDWFRAKAANVEKAKDVKKVLNCKAQRFENNKIVVSDKKGNEQVLEFDKILVQFGLATSYGQIKNWGMEFEKGRIKVDGHLRSSIEGIWAIGNACYYEGKNYVITSGLGDVVSAMSSIAIFIDPKAVPVFYSTHSKQKH